MDEPFKVEEVVNPGDGIDLEFEPLWTDNLQDERIADLLTQGGWKSNMDIKIFSLTRGNSEQRTVDDYLLAFFGRCRFIAATLDGIVDEKVIDALTNL